MLIELSIRDFAIIDELRLAFEPGFNALTGETGAGKSILIDALGAVLGERVGADVVRTGAKAARIEATFDVAAARRPAGRRRRVRRARHRTGRRAARSSAARSRPAAAASRADQRPRRDRRHARRGSARCWSTSTARATTCRCCDPPSTSRSSTATPVCCRRGRSWPRWSRELRRAAGADRRRSSANARERAQRVDLLRFQVDEIDAAAAASRRGGGAAGRAVGPGQRRAAGARRRDGLRIAGRRRRRLRAGRPAQPALGVLRQASEQLAEIAAIDPAMQPTAERADRGWSTCWRTSPPTRATTAIGSRPTRRGWTAVEERLDRSQSAQAQVRRDDRGGDRLRRGGGARAGGADRRRRRRRGAAGARAVLLGRDRAAGAANCRRRAGRPASSWRGRSKRRSPS